jgi:putative FmdB family regulatory protein
VRKHQDTGFRRRRAAMAARIGPVPAVLCPLEISDWRTGGVAMPLYGFHCAKCDGDVELLIGFSETPICPTCGSKRLQRLMSLTAPHGKSRGVMKSARAQAAREGHLSNFSRAERRR